MKKTIHALGLAGLISLSLESCRVYTSSPKSCPAYTRIKIENERDSKNQDYKYQSHTSQPALQVFYTQLKGGQ